MEGGLTIHKDAVWRSPVVAGGFTQVHSPHACTVTLINTSNNKHPLIHNVYEDSMAAAEITRDETEPNTCEEQ